RLRGNAQTAQVAAWIETEAVRVVKEPPQNAPQAFLDASRAKKEPPVPPATPAPVERERENAIVEIHRVIEQVGVKDTAALESRLDALAKDSKRPAGGVWLDYLFLASFSRFQLKDPQHAIALYEKARPFASPQGEA